jgi:bifunctional ADP-heptose synthase (sugar kinase/adenylyltransferase)
VPVFNPHHTVESGGMAWNVQANVRALDMECDIATPVYMPAKTRYVDVKTNQMLLRVDDDDTVLETYDHKDDLDDYEAIIVADYDKGFLSEGDIETICLYHPRVFVDSKKLDLAHASNARFIKINEYEYQKAKRSINIDDERLIVTYGGQGCRWNGKMYPPPKEREVRDVSGAGDTFMAAFVATLIMSFGDGVGQVIGQPYETWHIENAIAKAQDCASMAVSRKGVVTC